VQQYVPHPIDNVIEKVKLECPKVLFAPHVETSTGMILPDEYIRKSAEAVHDVGGLFVLDCIASGAIWVSRVGYIS
jgi:alanine-glyoxylate transaminase/serine-glyoxylate transaminase/serine-pyruvate transaminase